MGFSASDNDNDACSCNCAGFVGAGNWWKNCGKININGKYGVKGDIGEKFNFWYHFDNNYMALKSMTLMFRQAD